MYCKHIKIKQKNYKKYIYCNKWKKEIHTSECRICELKEYAIKEQKRMKQQSTKQRKLESERFSLFTDNLDKCFFCENPRNDKHEVFRGRNKPNSMRYGLVLPICRFHHDKYQNDVKFNDKWHVIGQKKFQEVYPELDFLDIFKINYL